VRNHVDAYAWTCSVGAHVRAGLATRHESQNIWRVAQDPVARLWARDARLDAREEMRARGGGKVRLDAGNAAVLKKDSAEKESGEAMRVTMDLHAVHMFTHAFATDGSKAEGRMGRTAFGLWSGADMEKWGAERDEARDALITDDEIERKAVGEGLEGGRLPATWEVVDAEMYAVFRALLRVYREAVSESGEAGAKACRVLVLTDCQSAMGQIERAWRQGEMRHESKGDRRAMLEAICRVRAKLGVCVLCYVPAHEGCSPNEYADACAKGHLGAAEMEDVTSRVARWVETTPRVMERYTKEEGWVTMDRAAYKGVRQCATLYARQRMAEGVGEGRVSAGAKGKVWKAWGVKAMKMTAPEATTQGVVKKPTWEDAAAHMENLGVVMGMRNADGRGVPHEREWERKCESEGKQGGPATRAGEDGCAACRKAAIERVKAAAARGVATHMPNAMPKATWRHWLTGPCAAADDELRTTMKEHATRIASIVRQTARGAAKEMSVVCDAAAEAMRKATAREVVTYEEYEALAQVMAAQMPTVEGDVEKRMSKRLGELEAERKELVHTALAQRRHAEAAGRGVTERRKQQEEHRGWMMLVLRMWAREARKEGGGVLRLRALVRAEVDARRASVRTGRKAMRVMVEGRGDARRLVRVDEEKWWSRLQQRVHAVAAWARVHGGDTRRWYVRGEGRGIAAAETNAAARPERDAGMERRGMRAQPAAVSTREGVRLWWWLEGGEGADASGPASVRRGVHTKQDADPVEARAGDGDATDVERVESAAEPPVARHLEEESGEGLDELGIDDVLNDDEAGPAGTHVGEGVVDEGDSGGGTREGTVAVEGGVRLTRRSAQPDVDGGCGDGGGGSGVGVDGGGSETARGPRGEEGTVGGGAGFGGEDVVPVGAEQRVEGGSAGVHTAEGGGVTQTAARGEGGNAELTEQRADDTSVNGAAEGGDGLGGREERREEHGMEGRRGWNGEGAGDLRHREVLASGREHVVVGRIGGGNGQHGGVRDTGGEGGRDGVTGGAVGGTDAAGDTLRADDGGHGRRRQRPIGQEGAEARLRRRRRTAAMGGGIQPGVEGGRIEDGGGGQLERQQTAETGAALLHHDAHAVDLGGSRAAGQQGVSGAVEAEDALGQSGGGGATEAGEEGNEGVECNVVAENQIQGVGTSTTTATPMEGGESGEGGRGSGQAPTRSLEATGTGGTGRGGGGISAAAEESLHSARHARPRSTRRAGQSPTGT
jgi:ribonuclease HI